MFEDLVPIHMHSDYSLGDGAQRVDQIVERCLEIGYKSCSLTDHGVMTGSYPFEREALKAGIKPIHGCEVYVDQTGGKTLEEISKLSIAARSLNKEKSFDDPERIQSRSHLVLLAQSEVGYSNLLHLTNTAIKDRFYSKPLCTWEEILENSEGLICTTACVAGFLSKLAIAGDEAALLRQVQKMKDSFGDRVYLELQLNSIPAQKVVNQALLRASERIGVPIVLGMDAHYPTKKDGLIRRVVMASAYKLQVERDLISRVDDEWEEWIKSPAELEELAKAHPYLGEREIRRMVESTQEIADRCSFSFATIRTGYKFPSSGAHPDDDLRDLVREGLLRRFEQGFFKEEVLASYVERAKLELDQIASKGYAPYFLATAQVVDKTQASGVTIGPGRGSAAGSLVNFALGVTLPDPVRFNLSFERFLNPARGSVVVDLGL